MEQIEAGLKGMPGDRNRRRLPTRQFVADPQGVPAKT
jgi:hypothetical protein